MTQLHKCLAYLASLHKTMSTGRWDGMASCSLLLLMLSAWCTEYSSVVHEEWPPLLPSDLARS